MNNDFNSLFNISNSEEFEFFALQAFQYQLQNNPIYKKYIELLAVNYKNIKHSSQIPCLPVEFFKSHRICCTSNEDIVFTSSGTSGAVKSKHFVSDINVYVFSFTKAFNYFYGQIDGFCIIALLPSYLEREGSSLVYMAEHLIKKSKHPKSNFYLHNIDELIAVLNELKTTKQKTILLGVSYALLDLAEKQIKLNDNFIVMETGGMKGKRKEMIKEELHNTLREGLGVSAIHSEYGMTELLSQAYSKGNGIYECPPWMQVNIRDMNDPFALQGVGKTGGVNVIDLANWNSCPFISTQDLGKKHKNNTFEVLGRFDNSDIRGCNLLIE